MITTDKRYRTKSGLPVRIYATDHGPDYPIAGAIEYWLGWDIECWDSEGRYYERTMPDFDLVEVVTDAP